MWVKSPICLLFPFFCLFISFQNSCQYETTFGHPALCNLCYDRFSLTLQFCKTKIYTLNLFFFFFFFKKRYIGPYKPQERMRSMCLTLSAYVWINFPEWQFFNVFVWIFFWNEECIVSCFLSLNNKKIWVL